MDITSYRKVFERMVSLRGLTCSLPLISPLWAAYGSLPRGFPRRLGVVRLMFINSAGELFIVARFDTAHSIAHFDRLSKSGRLLEKLWLNGLDFNRAYEYALNEFRQNHKYYAKRWNEF